MKRALIAFLALLLSTSIGHAQRVGIPEASTYAELDAAIQTPYLFELETSDGFKKRPAAQSRNLLEIARRPGTSRWSEYDIPFPYWATTTDRNHKSGKYRLNVGRRGVRMDFEFTVRIDEMDFTTPDPRLLQSWALLFQIHGTPSYNEQGQKIGTNAQTTLGIRMDGQTFRGTPHWTARLHGKLNPGATRADFETAVDARFMTAHVGQEITFRGSWLEGMDGSDGWPVGRSLLTYELPNDNPGEQFVIYNETGPNYMAVLDEPNTAQYRPRLGWYVHPVQQARGQRATFSGIRGRYDVGPWPWDERIDF